MKKQDFIEKLEHAYPTLKREYEAVSLSSVSVDWGEKYLYNYGWKTTGVKFKGVEISGMHGLFPELSKFVHSFPELIVTAGYSSMESGTIIHPHFGQDKTVTRFHLGIDIPEGDCALKVEETIYRWENGKAFYFDDTKKHEAWNKTAHVRVALLLDLKNNQLQ